MFTKIYKRVNIVHTTIPAYNNFDIGEAINILIIPVVPSSRLQHTYKHIILLQTHIIKVTM